MYVIRNTAYGNSCHFIFARDATNVGVEAVTDLFADQRTAFGGAEDNVDEAADVAVRHKAQSSLKGLGSIFWRSVTQDGFAKSANLVLGYFQVSHSGLKNVRCRVLRDYTQL